MFSLFFVRVQVPHVNRTDYQLIDISEDDFVSSPVDLELWLQDVYVLFVFQTCCLCLFTVTVNLCILLPKQMD